MMLTRTLLTTCLCPISLLLITTTWSARAQQTVTMTFSSSNDNGNSLAKEIEEDESSTRQLLRHPAEQNRALTTSCRAHRLGECESHCVKDCDCRDGLVCYLRDDDSHSKYFYYGGLRDNHIPGCSSRRPDNYSVDYCINPHKFPTKTLWYIGSDGGTAQGQPAFLYPLKECWGDCDKDSDCAHGLKCFHRTGSHPNAVPGCNGTPVKDIDYCYKPPAPPVPVPRPAPVPAPRPVPHPVPRPAPRPVPVPTTPKLEYIGNCHRKDPKIHEFFYNDNSHYDHCNQYPMGSCQGDCDASYDCAGDLVCLQRDRYTSDYPIWGCSGTAKSVDTDYCIDPWKIPADNPYLIYWGNDGTWPSSVYPFGRCQGDCDSDKDCRYGYKCIGTDAYGKIPGCKGYLQKHANYCV